jgi:DNA-directed RNA polymerase subunit H (RpoH/RPB5)
MSSRKSPITNPTADKSPTEKPKVPKRVRRPQLKSSASSEPLGPPEVQEDRSSASAASLPLAASLPPPAVQDEKGDDVKIPQETKSTAPTVATSVASRYPAMNDNFVFIDNVYRSRHTLLDILRDRGYEVSKYEKFSPAEATAAASSFTGLSFHVTKADEKKQCHVRYENISQQKLKGPYFTEMIPDEDCENVEVILMMTGSITDTHNGIALKEYMRLKEEPNEKGIRERRKLRVSFFSIEMLVINPTRHILVPKHEIVPEEEHKTLMDRLYVISKSKFPEIKFHADMIARCIGAVPGDIVKITRPSASSGEAIIYRVCAP